MDITISRDLKLIHELEKFPEGFFTKEICNQGDSTIRYCVKSIKDRESMTNLLKLIGSEFQFIAKRIPFVDGLSRNSISTQLVDKNTRIDSAKVYYDQSTSSLMVAGHPFVGNKSTFIEFIFSLAPTPNLYFFTLDKEANDGYDYGIQ